jgi:hypothetical protein
MRGLVRGLSNEEYHKVRSGADFSVSSSQLKDMLSDPEKFYKKNITKELEREENAAFDVGTYFHSAILEPEKLHEDCIVWEGGVRRGVAWDQFKALHPKKAIITLAEKEKAELMISGVKKSSIAMSLLSDGEAEVSCYVLLTVAENNIYAQNSTGEETFLLRKDGWVPVVNEGNADIPGIKILVKVRADYLAEGYVADLKSSSGVVTVEYEIQQKNSSYGYDLSASLYVDIFNVELGNTIKDFVWIYASKESGTCACYKADPLSLQVGRGKWAKAVIDLAKFMKNKWQFSQNVTSIGPMSYETHWANFLGR